MNINRRPHPITTQKDAVPHQLCTSRPPKTGCEKQRYQCQQQTTNTRSVSLNAFKQPKAFYLIFSIELWERFGYYGLQGIMAVYLVKMLGMSEADSITLFSSFSAPVYGFVAIGGWLGDKVLGAKRVIVLGALLAAGYAMVAYSGHDIFWVYMGMATIAVGSGLFKANPSSLLSTCYEKDDPRIDGAFTMYYMSVNIGSFFSMLATPWLAAKYGWSVAFSLSVVGMLITTVQLYDVPQVGEGKRFQA